MFLDFPYFCAYNQNTTKEINMGEKGQIGQQNMDFISDAGHFVQGAGNAVQYAAQSVINDLGTNNNANLQAEKDQIAGAYAAANASANPQGTMASAGTPVSQAPQSGEKGNFQTGSTHFTGQAALEAAASAGAPIATTGIQGGGISPTVRGTSPAAGPTINPNPPIK
jgi:hypothetical protein